METRDLYKSVDLKVFHWDMKAKLKAAFTPESVVNAFKKLYQNRTTLSVADAEAVERAIRTALVRARRDVKEVRVRFRGVREDA